MNNPQFMYLLSLFTILITIIILIKYIPWQYTFASLLIIIFLVGLYVIIGDDD